MMETHFCDACISWSFFPPHLVAFFYYSFNGCKNAVRAARLTYARLLGAGRACWRWTRRRTAGRRRLASGATARRRTSTGSATWTKTNTARAHRAKSKCAATEGPAASVFFFFFFKLFGRFSRRADRACLCSEDVHTFKSCLDIRKAQLSNNICLSLEAFLSSFRRTFLTFSGFFFSASSSIGGLKTRASFLEEAV